MKEKIYFPNLNGLRFIAATLVIIHHIEQLKGWLSIPNYFYSVGFINIIGKLGVVLFFTLSGFLITFLLLKEEEHFKKINIKDFYIRRILKIWPLYFLIIFLAFAILPQIHLFTLPEYGKNIIYEGLEKKLTLYFLFLANLPAVGIIPYASHLWSISTEEQFYLIWPVLFGFVKKYRIKMLVSIVVIYILIHYFLCSDYSFFLPDKKFALSFWNKFNIDCMAIGAIFAILLYKKNKILQLLNNIYFFYFVLVFTIFLLLIGFKIHFFWGIFNYEFYATLFGIIILNFASNKKIQISLEQKQINYLGKISYGLYMYHPIAIILAIKISLFINAPTNWLIYPLAFIFTTGFASFSYKYFESYFLKLKPKFSKILSGDEIKKELH